MSSPLNFWLTFDLEVITLSVIGGKYQRSDDSVRILVRNKTRGIQINMIFLQPDADSK